MKTSCGGKWPSACPSSILHARFVPARGQGRGGPEPRSGRAACWRITRWRRASPARAAESSAPARSEPSSPAQWRGALGRGPSCSGAGRGSGPGG